MKFEEKEVSMPILCKLSFFKIVEALEANLRSGEEGLAQHAKLLLDEISKVPELIEGTKDFSIVEKHKPLVNKIMDVIFPSALTLNEIKGVTPPFEFSFFHISKRLENILATGGKDFEIKIEGFDPDTFYKMGCVTILQAYYKYPASMGMPIVFDIPDETGELRYYRGAFNADLMEIKPTKNAIEITEEDFWELIDNFYDLDLWKKKFPPNSWEVRGIGLMNLMDITVDQSVNMITSNLLAGKDSFDKVLENIRSLLRIKDVGISFIQYEQNMLGYVNMNNESSILLNEREEISIDEGFTVEMKKVLLEEHKAFIVSDSKQYINKNNNLLSKRLETKNILSYLITSIEYQGEMIGFLELSSKENRLINSIVAEKLQMAIPLLSMAASRIKQESVNRVEAVIQEQFTSIHSSVKWRFEKAAQEYIEVTDVGDNLDLKDIVFEKVFPLYGQMDIRSSSVLRNKAVVADLSSQLKSVKAVVKYAIEKEPLPAYEEMVFRIDGYLNELKNGLVEGSEQRILSFLKSDVYPIFDHLKQIDNAINQKVQEYNALLNPQTNMIYDKRKAFDESVNQVNALLAEIVDEKQKLAQKMFPHYFERYKTDGLEYNIYIGQSISEKRKFNSIYLQNLQIWQLNTLCEMEHELYRLRKSLPMPLEVASLILVHNASLSINFRIDEKRFDVEGAYNARYEIIKKRVDKAYIKGTKERVTAPGKIVIVYTSIDDASVYQGHIKYLEVKGLIIPNSTEDLVLEDLQGVTGLKALRVTVDYSMAEKGDEIEKLIKESNPKE